MLRWKRVACLGFLSWLIPFASSALIFPVKQSHPALFSTGITLVLVITAGGLLTLYFRNRRVTPGEALLVGTIWLCFNLALDYPMFAYGPMKMTPAAYYSEIGLEYLVFPLVALWAARLARGAGSPPSPSTRPALAASEAAACPETTETRA